ncbi:uncharacterized protein [Antedon mediterranea]|uniref:uncharacterized protein isoform X2 n=1 Tax=Antedon mediterranea TaxID=105859 RepID=UPI003AF5DFDA
MNVYRLILYVFFSAYVGGSLEYGHGLGLNGKDKINRKSSLQTLDLMEKIKEQLSSIDEYNELESFNDVLDNIAVADHDYKVKEMMEESLLLVANLSNVEKSTRFKTSVTPLPSSFRLTAETVPVYMSTAANNMRTTDGYYADRSETDEVYRPPTYTPSTNNTSSTSVNLITEVLDSLITKNYMHITDAELNLLNELLQKITVSEGKFRTNNFELIAEIVHTIVSLKNKDNFSRNDEAETTNLQNIESLTNILRFLYQSNVEFSKGEIDRLKWLIKPIDDSFDTFEVFSNIKDLENAMNLTNNSKPTFKEVSQSQDYKKQVKSIFTPAVTKSAQETENTQVETLKDNLNIQTTREGYTNKHILENNSVNALQSHSKTFLDKSLLDLLYSSNIQNEDFVKLDLEIFLAKNFNISASDKGVRWLINNMKTVLNFNNDVMNLTNNNTAKEGSHLPDYQIQVKTTFTPVVTKYTQELTKLEENTEKENPNIQTTTEHPFLENETVDILQPNPKIPNEPIFTTKTPYKWSEWASWQACSVTCGKGIKVATRECKLYIESLEVKSNLCKGNATKVDECVQSYCPLSKDHQTTASYEYFNSTNTTDWIINEMKKEKREIQVVDVIITIVVVFIALLIIFVTIRIRSIMMMDDKSDIEISRISKFSGKPKGLIKKHAQWLKEFGTSMKSKKQPQTDTTTKNINIDQFLKELDEVESDCSD